MTRLAATVLALLTLLTGCGLGERFQSAEDRINRLVPPTLALRNASEQLAATPEPQAGANAALEAQRKTRLKLRALSCARDVTPSWLTSDDDLRSRLGDKACFAAADQEMARWLNLVRVGRLLAQGPLRPIPAQPAALLASNDFVYTAAFAEQAGVALLGSSNKLVALDLANGQPIWQETRTGGMGPVTLSPNGRLFRSLANEKHSIRAVDGGEVLVEFAARQNFAWLDPRYILTFDSQKNETELLELASGRRAPVAGLSPGASQSGLAAMVPGTSNRFVLFSGMQAHSIEISHQDNQLQARLLAEQSGVPGWGNDRASMISLDGLTAMAGSQALSFLNLKDLALTKVQLEPMKSQAVLPTSKPDEVLLSAFIPDSEGGGATLRHFLLSRGANTLAPVETEPPSGSRFIWIAPLKSLALADARRIALIPHPKAGTAKPIGDAVADFLEAVNQSKLAKFAASMQSAQPAESLAQMPSARSAAGGLAMPVTANAPLAALSADAQIEGVGVYQGAGAASRPGQPHPAGAVEVRVRRGAKPIVLVLSSYEPVRWTVVPESGARIAAVLVSSYYTSHVVGAGGARVMQIGRDTAYSRDSEGYPELHRTVLKWTGKPLGIFQGRYEGSSFSVGGP